MASGGGGSSWTTERVIGDCAGREIRTEAGPGVVVELCSTGSGGSGAGAGGGFCDPGGGRSGFGVGEGELMREV